MSDFFESVTEEEDRKAEYRAAAIFVKATLLLLGAAVACGIALIVFG